MESFERRKCKRPECNNTFIPTRKDHIYCCNLCRESDRARKARERYVRKPPKAPKLCKMCNKEFIPKRATQVYCCNQCRKMAERQDAKRPVSEESKPKRVNASLVEMSLKAKEFGTSYGKLEASAWMKKERV